MSACQVCTHAERRRIELLIAGGASRRAVAKKFGVNNNALHRHWHGHVDGERKQQLALGPGARMALAARVAEESESVVDHFRVVRAELYALLTTATEAGDFNAAANVAGKLIGCLDSMGRVTGELSQSPLLQINQQTTNYFFHSPEFALFQSDLIRVLSRFPEARAAVVAEFERIETEAQPTALEHDEEATDAV